MLGCSGARLLYRAPEHNGSQRENLSIKPGTPCSEEGRVPGPTEVYAEDRCTVTESPSVSLRLRSPCSDSIYSYVHIWSQCLGTPSVFKSNLDFAFQKSFCWDLNSPPSALEALEKPHSSFCISMYCFYIGILATLENIMRFFQHSLSLGCIAQWLRCLPLMQKVVRSNPGRNFSEIQSKLDLNTLGVPKH